MKMLKMAILAGGMATRMYPLTESCPKSLLPVAGRPFIAWQLEYIQQQGVENVVLCLGNMAEKIIDYVGDGSKFGLRVEYSYDGAELLGTGGAINKALPLLGDAFFVIYGDSYLPIKLSDVQQSFHKFAKPVLMTVFHNKDCWDASNVCLQGDLVYKYDKRNKTADMEYIDYGLLIISAEFMRNVAERKTVFDLADCLNIWAKNNELAAFLARKRFFEIGSQQGLKECEEYLRGL